MRQFDLMGKSSAAHSVKASINAKRLSHAIMITGEKGIGKKTFANYICSLLVCEAGNKPCYECVPCNKIIKGIHPDVYKIYPAGKSETIGVNEIKPIKENLYIKPNDANCKIFILYEADRMNRFAQNAMLKMIEEPPEDSYFIFTCKNSQALLPTVRSRMVNIALSPASKDEVYALLENRMPQTPKEALKRAAELCCGNIGLALEIIEDEKVNRLYEDVENVAKAVCDSDRALLTLRLGKYSADKESAVRLVELLKLVFRDTCALNAGNAELLSGCAAAEQLSKTCGGKACLDLMVACDRFLAAIKGNANLALSLADFEISLGKAVGR
ncbi:MAG: hypothetical protein E7539_02640 [Ruminococcaceae bacterium]|nr:hypothetical protein [Oscillospiraceae bacterium]